MFYMGVVSHTKECTCITHILKLDRIQKDPTDEMETAFDMLLYLR